MSLAKPVAPDTDEVSQMPEYGDEELEKELAHSMFCHLMPDQCEEDQSVMVSRCPKEKEVSFCLKTRLGLKNKSWH